MLTWYTDNGSTSGYKYLCPLGEGCSSKVALSSARLRAIKEHMSPTAQSTFDRDCKAWSAARLAAWSTPAAQQKRRQARDKRAMKKASTRAKKRARKEEG